MSKEISPVALHALQMAMQSELDTVRIYKKMLKRVKNKKTLSVLEDLIKEEFDHEKRVKEKFLGAGGEFPEPENDFHLPQRDHLLEIELENCSSLELINIAMENERISRDFYVRQRDVAENDEVREIFNWLVREETQHIKNLKADFEAHKHNYNEVEYEGE